MKVILIKDVKGLGHAHETITASDGYALNYLIPGKFAVAATKGAAATAEAVKTSRAGQAALEAGLFAQNLASLAEVHLTMRRKANEKGHLYDAVDARDIVTFAKEVAQVDLPEEAVKLEKPIKEVGTFTIPVAHGETFGSFNLIVEAE